MDIYNLKNNLYKFEKREKHKYRNRINKNCKLNKKRNKIFFIKTNLNDFKYYK